MTMQQQELSAAKAIAGFSSFMVPGLGQLLLNRKVEAGVFFLWFWVSIPFAVALFQTMIPDTPVLISLVASASLAVLPNIFAAYWASNK